MALVSYSDSDASDSEQENVPQPPTDNKRANAPAPNPPKPSGPNNIPSIVDRTNPRKIRVALPEIKPESATDGDDQEDGPARKKPRIGADGGGGAFSGFNAMLPAPKRNNAVAAEKKTPGSARKVFGLKTGAEPGFSREADEEMRMEQADGVDGTIPKAGSLQTAAEPGAKQVGEGGGEAKEEPKLKGNAMMFKPLSVGRNQKKKKPTATAMASEAQPHVPPQPREDQQPVIAEPPARQPKPKVNLFSLSTEERSTTPDTGTAATTSTGYQPLMYNATHEAPPAGPERPAPELVSEEPAAPTTLPSAQGQTLGNIADDLNLSRSERRQLFGRHDASSNSRVLHFNTDTEYEANQEMAESTDMAAAQHNPVRAIAPGKHTLQQLVNAASTQREALEESFATGRRNKKEAGSKYGW
ncbi:hypothetical protein PHISP_05348 [Aspergillus sp. HF37]|nr:hypothetical protein PHISP_05348 [Aspergillus sp. HF37]